MSKLQFEYVKFKNLLSYGNNWTTIELDKAKSTLILGENGAGKSTFIEAITFALYGKPFRKINKGQLVNSINGSGLEVEVSFTTNSKHYLVKRSIKPNRFEIYCNGDLLDQTASIKDYQTDFEENVLKMNYKTFGQIVVLGATTFVPFMQLSAAARREIIEDLLDIQIFTTMNTLLKEEISGNKLAVQSLKNEIEMIRGNIEYGKKQNEKVKAFQDDHIEEMKSRIEEHKENNIKLKVNKGVIEGGIRLLEYKILGKNEFVEKKGKMSDIMAKLKARLSTTLKHKTFFEKHDTCPTCSQRIEPDFQSAEIERLTEEITKIDEGVTLLKEKILSNDKDLSGILSIESEINSKKLEISKIISEMEINKTAIKSVEAKMNTPRSQDPLVDEKDIRSLITKLDGRKKDLKAKLSQAEIDAAVALMLKDGGIKTKIIKQYVPVINTLINKYLAAMEFFVDFQLDESFNETIKSRFRDDFSYASFSEGEKARIDLALLLTWRSVSRLRNSVSTNLLIMDEVFDGSLDSEGTASLLEILTKITDDSNIFIISHKGDQLSDKFEQTLRFTKRKNFSVIET